MNGLSYRKIELQTGISKSKAQKICLEELKKLPDNNQFTYNHCNRFSQIYELDAKYVNIKGYERKLAFLWGVDYERHDFPIILLAKTESFQAWGKFCELFKIINHYPKLIVCDNNSPLKTAARYKFPNVKIQTCYNHFKEGVRRDFKIRSDGTYRQFSNEIDELLSIKRSTMDFESFLLRMFDYYKNDPVALQLIVNIGENKKEFLAFQGISGAPTTTNMIESFNSHLEARLKPLHHFHSFAHAKLWLNGYVLKRRYTKFVSCKGKFKRMNGRRPLDMTKKVDVVLPGLF